MGAGCLTEFMKIFIFILVIISTMVSCIKDGGGSYDNEYSARFYLEEKYNINKSDYKVLDRSKTRLESTCKTDCGYASLVIEYKGKKYQIFYNDKKKKYSDSLQVPEITSDLIESFNSMYDKPDNIKITINDNIYNKYDGSNLKEVVSNLEVKAYYKNSNNFSNEKADKFVNDFYKLYGGRIELIYFENEEDYNKYLSIETPAVINESKYSYDQKYINFYVMRDKNGLSKHNSTKVYLGDGITAVGWDIPIDLRLEEVNKFDLTSVQDLGVYNIKSKYYKITSPTVDNKTIDIKIVFDKETLPLNPFIVYREYASNTMSNYKVSSEINKNAPIFSIKAGEAATEFVLIDKKN